MVTAEPIGNAATTVTVTGSACATATPDIARLTIGVSETHPTVADAVDALARHSAALTEALHEHSVAGPDLVTTGLSVHPQTQWVDGGRQETTGFTASTSFRAVLRDLTPGAAHSPAAVITACVAAGGDAIRLDSLEFDLEDRTELTVRARESAWVAALSKARQFADLAQKNLVDVLEITEGVDQMSPVRGLVSAARAVSAPIAVEHGEIEETISVRVRWSMA
ncbi:SIMPL domain-containing protein [Rhodococcus sp. IEGM 1379]|uniref:SIMPL domain-containing protein n=1 Tax=Rhodococcus sp. IEGM 1379 TaxID=3047086 RepID=UPI0024B841EA|nr:SIMPL domain-containing protein [Rhodococcus sp. IEGM 1379]MDI9916450.1 SIMPL domain-containing protein [Rhodococcus sp. IEGM 1379]